MASSTVTVDTNEWVYIDSFGSPHTVTNAQTFTLTVTDGGVAAVEYNVAAGQNVTTTDGLNLIFRPETDAGNAHRKVHFLTDAGQGSAFHSLGGEIPIECPVSGRIQRWRAAQINPSDADYGSAGTIAFTLEDQFGNRMSATGITVGQAS